MIVSKLNYLEALKTLQRRVSKRSLANQDSAPDYSVTIVLFIFTLVQLQ